MRVLHVIVGLNVGGAELMLKRLVDPGTPNNELEHSVIWRSGIDKALEH